MGFNSGFKGLILKKGSAPCTQLLSLLVGYVFVYKLLIFRDHYWVRKNISVADDILSIPFSNLGVV